MCMHSDPSAPQTPQVAVEPDWAAVNSESSDVIDTASQDEIVLVTTRTKTSGLTHAICRLPIIALAATAASLSVGRMGMTL